MKSKFVLLITLVILLSAASIWFLFNGNRLLVKNDAPDSTSEPAAESTSPPLSKATAVPLPSVTPRIHVGPHVTMLAPDFNLTTLAGDTVRLEDYRLCRMQLWG